MAFAEKSYIGTLDDAVARYPWFGEPGYPLEKHLAGQDPRLEQDMLRRFNATLQFNALLGRELMINDGYLLNHPASRIALLEPSRSPLRAMLEGNRINILQRNPDLDLDETALLMAEQNNTAFQTLTGLPDWPGFRQELRNVSRIAGARKRWPRADISEGLDKLLQTLAGADVVAACESLDDRDMEQLLACYTTTREQRQTAPRDAWEIAALDLFGEQRNKLYEAMQLANVFYHINFALCLAAETPAGTAVETISSSNTAGLLERSQSPLSAADAAEIHNALAELSGCLYFPDPEEALDGEKLCALYSGVRGSAGAAKLDFLQEIERSRASNFSATRLRQAAKNYSEALQALFNPSPNARPTLTMSMDVFVREDMGKSAEVGAKSTIGNLLRDYSIEGALEAGSGAAAVSMCIDFGKRIAIAALPYLAPPRTGVESQFLKNIKNRNRLFHDVTISMPVSRELAQAHTGSLQRFVHGS